MKNTSKVQIPLMLDGKKYNFDIDFESPDRNNNPLVSILFNGKTVGEFYMPNMVQTLYLKLQSKLGKNILEISVLDNRGSIIVKRIKIYK